MAAPTATMARTLAPAPAAATVVPPAAPAQHLSAEVVGYLPYWEMNAATFADIDLTKVSSIVLFSVGWDAAGGLVTNAPGYQAIMRSDTTAFVAAAHAAGVRVLVSFTSFGLTKNTSFFSNAPAQLTLISEAAASSRRVASTAPISMWSSSRAPNSRPTPRPPVRFGRGFGQPTRMPC